MDVRLLFVLVLQIALCGDAIAEQKSSPIHGQSARVGVLWPSPAKDMENLRIGLENALREVGYVRDQNMVLEQRFAATRDQLQDLAADLIKLKCDLVVAIGTPATLSIKQRTTELPVVFFDVGDPVAAGLVQDLSRPGGNVTGFASLGPELSVKLVELAKEVVPNLSRVGVLWDRENPSNARQLEELVRAAPSLKLRVYPIGVRKDADFTNTLKVMRKQYVGALVVLRASANVEHARLIASLAMAQRLPLVGAFERLVEEGALMAYFPPNSEMWTGVARYVSQILDGARPATLPVQQPTRFAFVLNMKTAASIGATIPESLRLRADRVIQ